MMQCHVIVMKREQKLIFFPQERKVRLLVKPSGCNIEIIVNYHIQYCQSKNSISENGLKELSSNLASHNGYRMYQCCLQVGLIWQSSHWKLPDLREWQLQVFQFQFGKCSFSFTPRKFQEIKRDEKKENHHWFRHVLGIKTTYCKL